MLFRAWKKTGLIILSTGLMALSLETHADNLDITFTANIRDTTCDMKIEGGSGDGTSNVIPIGTNGKVRLDYIILKNAKATTNFKLKMVSCPPSLASLKTTISGSASPLTTAIKNSLSGDGSAENIGVAISRTATPNTPFVINSSTDTQRLVWSSGEISAGEVPLLATLVETANGQGTTGNFSGIATFNFTYE
ncbi:fimbrial protein [Enterobacter cloacae]|uniref:fimbrial protein n=1 Tax=Enterobacter cloacae TaxID=550 RepID=UPI0005894AF5|nr:fimbrial protein [Enterobacter cloacae]KIF94798.1 fimbrial protein [Enterobacter cloacae]